MPAAALPPDEALRLAALRELRILDSPAEAAFDDLTRQAMEVCGTPVGLVSFVDSERQWFKSHFGTKAGETARDRSFCAHALLTPAKPLIVPDLTLDPRFADNPDVAGGPGYRFYAGFPLRSATGLVLGTLCVLDDVPRQPSGEQIDRLTGLAKEASLRLNSRQHARVERRLAGSFGLVLAVLLCLVLFSVLQAVRFLSSDRWVAHTGQVIHDVEHILFEVQAAESSQRGYTASGQETYLPPYQAAVALLPAQLAALHRAVSDNPAQQQRCDQLAARIEDKLAIMRERFEQRRTLGMAALEPKYLNGRGRKTMEAVIAAGNGMIEVENSLLRQRAEARAAGLRATVGLLLGISAVGACLLGAGFVFTRRELRRSHALGEELAQANLGLESEVAGRRRAQQRLAMQHSITRIAAENVSLKEAAPLFLRSICERLDWKFAELWTVDPAAGRMRLTDHWCSGAGSPEEVARDAEFAKASEGWTFARGEGLPGRVWRDGSTVWEHHLQDSACFLRTATARASGLHRAFAFPLGTGRDDQIAGAMVFLSKEQGAPDGELAAAMDTLAEQIAQFTQRCGAEAGLRASQVRFTAFIENAPALAYIKDPEGRMLYGNETLLRTFNLRADQWLGRTDADLWPEAAPAIRENDRAVLAGGGAVELNESVPLPDGKMARWLSYKFPLPDEASGRKLLAGMSIDITAREEAEDFRRAKEEAERTNQAKSEFLSRVSHELRTPLNAILGFGQLLQTSPLPDQDAEALEYILKAGRHLLTLVDEVLDLSRAESGELQLVLGSVDADETTGECVRLVERLAKEHGVSCEVRSAGEPALLWCDEKRLRQVLLNLLSNAIKYNRKGGSVFVSSERTSDNRLRLEVRDTGPGMPPGDLEKLFVPFERLGHKDGGIKGIGLGLVVSRRMAEAMGGTLGVASEVGRGTTFWIELPLSRDPVVGTKDFHLDPALLSALEHHSEVAADRRSAIHLDPALLSALELDSPANSIVAN